MMMRSRPCMIGWWAILRTKKKHRTQFMGKLGIINIMNVRSQKDIYQGRNNANRAYIKGGV